MARNSLHFADRVASEVMVPRTDMVCLYTMGLETWISLMALGIYFIGRGVKSKGRPEYKLFS